MWVGLHWTPRPPVGKWRRRGERLHARQGARGLDCIGLRAHLLVSGARTPPEPSRSSNGSRRPPRQRRPLARLRRPSATDRTPRRPPPRPPPRPHRGLLRLFPSSWPKRGPSAGRGGTCALAPDSERGSSHGTSCSAVAPALHTRSLAPQSTRNATTPLCAHARTSPRRRPRSCRCGPADRPRHHTRRAASGIAPNDRPTLPCAAVDGLAAAAPTSRRRLP